MLFRKIAAPLLCILLSASAAFGQFSFQKTKTLFSFEPPKTLTYNTFPRFNRVEGIALNAVVTLRPKSVKDLSLRTEIGWGFKNEPSQRLFWDAGVEYDFFLPARLTLGARAFDEIFTNDDWSISRMENSLQALFAHRDYMDYVGREGVQVYLDYKLAEVHTVRIEYSDYDYNVLSTSPNTDWSLFSFATDRTFAPNPTPYPVSAFAPGREGMIQLAAEFDFRDNPLFPISGWLVDAVFQKTFRDFETNGLFLTVKYFRPTFANQRLKTKLLFGSRTGSTAFQHLLTVGGIGTMRGYGFKEFVGNRMLFGTVQYQFGGDVLQRLPLGFIPFWDTLTLGAFVDFGYAWMAQGSGEAGLLRFGDNFSITDLRSNFGFSLNIAEGLLSLETARRTDVSGADWNVFFRVLGKF